MDRGGRYLRLDTGFVPIGAAVHEIWPMQVGTPVASLVQSKSIRIRFLIALEVPKAINLRRKGNRIR